jgi:ferrous iron transport protein A
MLPLAMAPMGEAQIVKKISGNAETKRHLEDLGFTVGGEVSIVSTLAGNLIVKVKESRIAVSNELARKIMV